VSASPVEISNSAYLYTLAIMSMTFVGFTAIVMILRQSLGSHLSRFDALVTRFFMVWGFLIAYASMLPPLLAVFEIPHALIWRVSSIVTGSCLILLSAGYPWLRSKVTGQNTPSFVFYQSMVGGLIGLVLLVNSADPFSLLLASAIYVTAVTATLVQASVGFVVTLNVILTDMDKTKPRRSRS